ncbi:transposase [Nonomuraea sp. NPDC004297]
MISFAWTNYRALLIAAHHQLGTPLVLIWDNLTVDRDARLHTCIDAQDWLKVSYLPPYAPDLNSVENIWSLLRRSSRANRAFTDPDHLLGTLRRVLRQLQYRRDVIDGCLAATDLNLTTSRLHAR